MKDVNRKKPTVSSLLEGELITLEKARMLYKGGQGISLKHIREKIKNREIPAEAVIDNGKGITLIHFPTLMCLA